MCVEGGTVRKADKSIVVWKVCGITTYNKIVTLFPEISIVGFKKQIKHEANGFDVGFGFSAFLSEKEAEKYMYDMLREIPRDLLIIKLKIPKGARYCKGRIGDGLFGSGMEAVRAEKLSPLNSFFIARKNIRRFVLTGKYSQQNFYKVVEI